MIRDELHRQADHLQAVESENARMKAELMVYRKRQTNIEILKEQKRELEKKAHDTERAQEQVAILQVQLDVAKKDVEEW